MDQYRVQWTRRALGRLDEIGEYLSQDDPAAAEHVVLWIVTAIDALAIHPSLGRSGRIKGTQEMVLADVPYIIAYRAAGEQLTVLTIMHIAQKWPLRF